MVNGWTIVARANKSDARKGKDVPKYVIERGGW